MPRKPPLAPPKVQLELPVEELAVLLTLAEDQLFRVKFIDPKMPGYKSDPNRIQRAESAIATLKEILGKGKPPRVLRTSDIQLVSRNVVQ